MKSAMAFAVGRVSDRGTIVSPSGKKAYVSCIIEMTRRFYGENKSYAQRIQFVSYSRNPQELVEQLTQGALVQIHGDIDAVASEHNGKHYANIRITGYATVIQEGGDQEQPQRSFSSGAMPQRTAAVAHGDTPSSPSAPMPGDDDVPF